MGICKGDKKFICKHITIRPDQNERIKKWPHGVLSGIIQDALDSLTDHDIEMNYINSIKRRKKIDVGELLLESSKKKRASAKEK
jgi:hypothetical protein